MNDEECQFTDLPLVSPKANAREKRKTYISMARRIHVERISVENTKQGYILVLTAVAINYSTIVT